MALQSRSAGRGSKPPRAALAEDRCGERRGKRRGWIASGEVREDERWVEPSAVDVSKLSQMRSEPGPQDLLGMSLGETRLLPRWSPAYRQHEPGSGSRMERVKARPDTAVISSGEREDSNRRNPGGAEYRCGTRWRTRP